MRIAYIPKVPQVARVALILVDTLCPTATYIQGNVFILYYRFSIGGGGCRCFFTSVSLRYIHFIVDKTIVFYNFPCLPPFGKLETELEIE